MRVLYCVKLKQEGGMQRIEYLDAEASANEERRDRETDRGVEASVCVSLRAVCPPCGCCWRTHTPKQIAHSSIYNITFLHTITSRYHMFLSAMTQILSNCLCVCVCVSIKLSTPFRKC